MKKIDTMIFLIFLIVISMGFSSILSQIDINILPTHSVKNNYALKTMVWSNATVISDDYTGWNDDFSMQAEIAIDTNGNLHVVWSDFTNGEWGIDWEIMYANYTAAGWSNATVISDDGTGWNNGESRDPKLAIDNYSNIHVVWRDDTDSLLEWGIDREIMYANYTAAGWSNATVISDVYGWNDGTSSCPDITIDNNNIHVVWYDNTVGEWGTGMEDYEIMYANYTGTGWSNATVISDDNTTWNNGTSSMPSIATDNNGNIHVVWQDETNGTWGIDSEIMYVNYTTSGWSNVTVISDIYGWNSGDSSYATIAIDNNSKVHVIWQDSTAGEWGGGIGAEEIMYTNYTGSVWSNATVISDDSTGWNNGRSQHPSIAIDNSGNIHVVWDDSTNGEWGTDEEIMYIKSTASGWSNATVISDDITGWNDGFSVEPGIIVDNNGYAHVVWRDTTVGEWGIDWEIMYSTSKPSAEKPGNQIVLLLTLIGAPSGDFLGLSIGIIIGIAATIVIIVLVIKKKR